MGNLIKMDFYRLRNSKTFWISNIVLFLIVSVLILFEPLMFKLLEKFSASGIKYTGEASLSDMLVNPISSMLLVIVFISIVSFTYADIANGYIKNIAGQVSQKGYTVISKFIVLGIHNFIFLCVGVFSQALPRLIVGSITIDDRLGAGIATFFIKWLLLMAISSILLFVSTGIRSKTFASVIGVILATGALSLVYLGLNNVIHLFFKTSNFDMNQYDPSVLIQSGAEGLVASNAAVFNALIVSVVVIAIFLPLTVFVFNKRDV